MSSSVPLPSSSGRGLTPWLLAVKRAVGSIRKGRTASYAQVALMAGKPGAARAVVQALHRLEGIAWWRVVRSDGTLAKPVAVEQRRRLALEGVLFEMKRKKPREAKVSDRVSRVRGLKRRTGS